MSINVLNLVRDNLLLLRPANQTSADRRACDSCVHLRSNLPDNDLTIVDFSEITIRPLAIARDAVIKILICITLKDEQETGKKESSFECVQHS